MKSGSFEEAISGEQQYPIASDTDGLLVNDEEPNSPCLKKGLLKKGGHKFKAAIKSLQCSPRVDEGDYGQLNESNKNSGTNNKSMLPPSDPSKQQQQQQQQQQPVFIANFEEFDSMNITPHAGEEGSVSKNLELDKVLVRLDLDTNGDHHQQDDRLEIFTNDTCDTDEGNEDEDKKSDVIQDLWNVSDPPLQLPEEEEQQQQQQKPSLVNSGAFPLSEWETPPSPKPFIHNEFSQYSQDSNDTPVTCNKSLIMTPKELRVLRQDDNDDNNHNSQELDLFGKPPKELLHRSLSLGDSLSPTEDESPTRQSLGDTSKNYLPQQHTLDALNLPEMNARRQTKDNEPSPQSSTVSSFVFEETPKPQRIVSPEARISPGFFWKTHPNDRREPPKAEPTSPAFFWKTHPRVTTKSYQLQRVPMVRRVHTNSGRSRHIAEVATS